LLTAVLITPHGGNALCTHDFLQKWQDEKRLISICPEVSAGLSVPRPSSEIVGNGGGKAVLMDNAKVITHSGQNKTDCFLTGAKKALALAQTYNIKMAILKMNSPSCGNNTIYDGSYTGTIIQEWVLPPPCSVKMGLQSLTKPSFQLPINFFVN
jgi:uncharacterized protein YbbK (DUF523 family)